MKTVNGTGALDVVDTVIHQPQRRRVGAENSFALPSQSACGRSRDRGPLRKSCIGPLGAQALVLTLKRQVFNLNLHVAST